MQTVKRKAKVHLLPTGKQAKVGEITINTTMPNSMFIMDKRVLNAWHDTPGAGNYGEHLIGNYLYITSDDEIKEGDWYHNLDMKTKEYGVIQADKRLAELATNAPSCRKIIAATNTSLTIKSYIKSEYCDNSENIECKIPEPSKSFIQKYIEEYNKGNIITDVMVEYEKGWKRIEEPDDMTHYENVSTPVINLKISKDNTITIHKLKDNFSREEVIALHKANCERLTNSYISSDIEWIEQNL